MQPQNLSNGSNSGSNASAGRVTEAFPAAASISAGKAAARAARPGRALPTHGGLRDLTDNPPGGNSRVRMQDSSRYLATRPLRALAGAVALGFIVGRLLRQRE